MTRSVVKSFGESSAERSAAGAKRRFLQKRWFDICAKHLPHQPEHSVWRYNRRTLESEPAQGWKLHVSATILNACDIFEAIVPLLVAEGVQFKAPNSLGELYKINNGLHYGYWQVGKFVTIYPPEERRAVELARRLHRLTEAFDAPAIPFDERYAPGSCVFYRYGGFKFIGMKNARGETAPAVVKPSGEFVGDDRFKPVPEWLSDPFQKRRKDFARDETSIEETPLTKTYRVFRALAQRGKGGTYQAFDTSVEPPRFCVVKEGRRFGEVGWDGADGYRLLKNERAALEKLNKNRRAAAPQVYAAFEVEGNFYLAMEYVGGRNLNDLIKNRRRRLPVKRTVELAVEIAEIVGAIHRAGLAWTDCKPANLIVTPEGNLRPIDFEGARPLREAGAFDWKTGGFSDSRNHRNGAARTGTADDLYSLGAVVYFLLTGVLYEPDAPLKIEKRRRGIPRRLREIIENLLAANPERKKPLNAFRAKTEFAAILGSLPTKS